MGVSVERLAGLPLFSALSPDELTAVGHRISERQCDAGTRLTVEGASGYSVFVIEKGDVEVELGDGWDTERRRSRTYPALGGRA